MKRIRLFIVFVVTFGLVFPPSLLAEVVGKVTYVEGRVDRRSENGDAFLPLIVGDEIHLGDSIRTKSYSKASVLFNDYSKLKLGDSTKIGINKYVIGEDGARDDAAIKLDRGNIRAIVSKTPDLAPFDIITPNAAGTVKGSDIFVSFQQSATNVFVAEGTFNVHNNDFPEEVAQIKEGMASVVPYNSEPEEPREYFKSEIKKLEALTGPMVIREGDLDSEFTKAKITQLVGKVAIKPKGAKRAHAATNEEVLSAGDTIETGKDGTVEISCDNGLIIELKPNTQFVILRLDRDPATGDYQSIFASDYGKIVSKLQNLPKNSKFQVKTPHAACGIRGTIMYLNIAKGMTQSFYEGGNGYVTDLKTGATNIIQEGMTARLDDEGNFIQVPTTDADRSGFGNLPGNEGNTYGYSSNRGAGNPPADPPAGGSQGGRRRIPPDIIGPGGKGTDVEIVLTPVNPAPEETPAALRMLLDGKFGYFGSFKVDEGSRILGLYESNPFHVTSNVSIARVLFGDNTPGADLSALFGTDLPQIDPLAGYNIVDLFTGVLSGNGVYDNPNGRSLFFGDTNGTVIGGNRLYGGMVGAGNDGNALEMMLYGIYADSQGNIGPLFADLGGAHTNALSGRWGTLGIISYMPVINPGIAPEVLSDSISDITQDDAVFSVRMFENNESYFDSQAAVRYLSVEGQPWSVWGGIFSAHYDRPEDLAEWTGLFAEEMDGGFVFGSVIASDDMEEGSLSMDISAYIMTLTRLFHEEGNISGYYEESNSYDFTGVGSGIRVEEPLAWSAEIDAEYNYYNAEDREVTSDESHYGLIGALDSPFGPSGDSVDIFLMGKTYPEGSISWWGNFNGSYAGDGSVLPDAFIAGRTNSAEGILSGLYIDNSGGAGILEGVFDGEYHEMVDGWLATGTITASEKTGGYDPENYSKESNYIDGNFEGGFGSGGDIIAENGLYALGHGTPESYTAWLINPVSETAESWGIFNLELGGRFDAEGPSDEWTLYLGGNSWRDLADREYWVAVINGNQWSDQRIEGVFSGFSLSGTAFGVLDGDVLGSYDTEGDDLWEGIALGAFDEQPLTFSGKWGQEESSLYYNDNGEFGWAGEEYGLIGATSSPWDGPVELLAMGEYYVEEERNAYIWHTPTMSYNELEDNRTTIDGGAFWGKTVGLWDDGSMTGSFAALYLAPDGKIGYIRNDETGLAGSYYPGLEMWIVNGVIAATPMEQTVGIDPVDFREYLDDKDIELSFTGYFGEGQGYIKGNIPLAKLHFLRYGDGDENKCDWGIFEVKIGGDSYYSDRPAGVTAWNAAHGDSNEGAYRVININGSWEDNGPEAGYNVILGDVFGIRMDHDTMTTIEGEGFGLNSENPDSGGSWIMSGAGSYRNDPLTFFSMVEDIKVITPRSFDGYDGGYDVGYDGKGELGINAFFGGILDVWAGSTGAHMVGELYNAFEDWRNSIWDIEMASYDWDNDRHTTYDGGAYYGIIAGAGYENSYLLDALFIALAISPDGGIGYISGKLDGRVHPYLGEEGMVNLDGSLSFVSMPGEVDLSPDDIFGYLNDMPFETKIVGSGMQELGTDGYAKAMIRGDSKSFGDVGWSIWRSAVFGEFQTDVLPVGPWGQSIAGVVETTPDNGEGSDIESTSYFLGYLGFTEWQNNGKLAADFDGITFSVEDDGTLTCGTVEGDFVGNNGSESEFVEAGEEFVGSWEAVGVGEWVEVEDLITDLTDLTDLVNEVAEFNVTEIRQDTLLGVGSGGIVDAVMDIALYADASNLLGGIWAAIINGTYDSEAITPDWGVNFDTGGGNSIDLDGVEWDNNEWFADVTGTLDGNVLEGTAAGTYDEETETFTGAGAGKWVEAP